MTLDQITFLLDGITLGVLAQSLADAHRNAKQAREALERLRRANDRIEAVSEQLRDRR